MIKHHTINSLRHLTNLQITDKDVKKDEDASGIAWPR